MASRSRGREFAVQMIYQHKFSGNALEKDMELFWGSAKADAGTRDFTEFLVRGVVDHATEMDMEISAYLKGWTLERIVLIDRIILQIAIFELTQTTETPWRVVVDEAVVLGRMFNTDKSGTFINGVLHAWTTKNRAGESKTAPPAEADSAGTGEDDSEPPVADGVEDDTTPADTAEED